MKTLFASFLAFATLAASVHAQSQTIAPVGAGAFRVGCTNVETTAARLPAGVTTEAAWRGDGVYVDRILTHPTTATTGPLLLQAKMPNKPTIYETTANQLIPTAAIACYPTTANNPRPDFTLVNGEVVPHMQRANERPIFADESKRYPVLMFAHGLGGAPLDDDYLTVIKLFASHGYVVVATFHADQRFTLRKLESLSDALDIVRNYEKVAEAMAIRPASLSALMDYFFAHEAFRDHIDTAQVGGWGASLGGQTMMLIQGAGLTTAIGRHDPEVTVVDKRIKAIVGYVPYSGIDYGSLVSVATFGNANEGVVGIRTPYLGITGTEDKTAPESQTIRMIRNLSGSKYHVSIQGLGHGLEKEHAPDILTWSLLFYRAHLFNDIAARTQIASLQSVTGGAPERVVTNDTKPWWYQDEVEVVEYFNAAIKHYFMTGIVGEVAMLDNNPSLGWARTGQKFIGWRESASTGTRVFRFYHDARGVGLNTHFFTLDATEAAGLRLQTRDWAEEISEWRAVSPPPTSCPGGTLPITRAYNNRFAFNDSNHRFMINPAIVNAMRASNWVIEGVAMCLAPAN
jgi:predicted dienelactone hydrolase